MAERDGTSPHARRLPSLPLDNDHRAPATTQQAANSATTMAERVPDAMNEWRMAIIHKNPEEVERLDRAFAERSQVFIPALMTSAATDPEERVRSFSTRVLGKLRPAESTELMRKLLSDQSEYVRFNAAWALGELSDREAAPRLRELAKADPAPSVRTSAAESLRKLGGG